MELSSFDRSISTACRQVVAAFLHQVDETAFISGRDEITNPGVVDSQSASSGTEAKIVQVLNFEIHPWIVMSDRAGHQQLGIKSCRRQLRKFGCRLTTLCQRGKKRDIQCMRQTQYIGDHSVVIVETHVEFINHRRSE